MTTELSPKFAVVVRGYDRAQVDAYIDTVGGQRVDGAARAEEASGEVDRLREQVEALRTRVAQLEQEARAEPPRSLRALGERVSLLLRLAEQGSLAVCADAEAAAVATTVRARQEAAEVSQAMRAQQASTEVAMAEAVARAAAIVEAAEARTAEVAARLLADAERRASAREADAERRASARQADAEVRALAIVKEAETRADTTIDQAEAVALNSVDQAEAERGRILGDLAEHRTQIASELQRLARERTGVLDDLNKLREALHRTITDVLVAPLPLDPPSAPTAPSAVAAPVDPPAAPASDASCDTARR